MPTPAIQLRDVSTDDLPVFFEQQNDPEAARMAAVPLRPRENFLAHWARILANGAGQEQTILFEGEIAGYLVCFERDGKREVGYWLGRAFWGKGISSAALGLFLTQIPMRPLHAWAARHNPGSIRVLEKNAFRITATEVVDSEQPGAQVEGFLFELAEGN